MPKKRKPQDAVVGNVKQLRKDVRELQKTVANEARYTGKKFKEIERAIYLLGLKA